MNLDFDATFRDLTGKSPFPWQRRLYRDHFSKGEIRSTCNLPTGLGKTSVIAVWLIALANKANVPRRLVYVVNRRTVIDQTTDEVEKYLERNVLGVPAFAVSTLRGQLADNKKWRNDPSLPAVICGTVDMIGSRLLFNGYGTGLNGRPLHAGFLGQDVLLVHDEAHLEPAFQRLIERIRDEQVRCKEFGSFRVMELTATPLHPKNAFCLDEEDLANEIIRERVYAKKTIRFHEVADEKKDAAAAITKLALEHADSNCAVVVFVRTVADAKAVHAKLNTDEHPAELLIGTLRGRERDYLTMTEVYQRFRPDATPQMKTVYLICTSAGEVGVNISGDHLVCDLTTYESMAQRFGRVNRFGLRADTRIDVVIPKAFDAKDPFRQQRTNTLELLRELPSAVKGEYFASPSALGDLSEKKRRDSFSPDPPFADATDILFDAWALTTITDDLPGRPPVEAYLHGIEEDKDHETRFAWREEVHLLAKLAELPDVEQKDRLKQLSAYLDEYPLIPQELLREPTYNAQKQLEAIAERAADMPAWVLTKSGKLRVTTVGTLAQDEYRDLIDRTVILPPNAGGLRAGLLEGKAPYRPRELEYDVADAGSDPTAPTRARFLWTFTDDNGDDGDETKTPWWQLGAGPKLEKQPRPTEENVRTLAGMIQVAKLAIGTDPEEDVKRIVAFVRPDAADGNETRSRASRELQLLTKHHLAIEKCVVGFAERLQLSPMISNALRLAARWHDLGKDRQRWQHGIGHFGYPDKPPLAKSGNARPITGLDGYRHEFGSLVDVEIEKLLDSVELLDADGKELVLHLIAAHHGRARPHFPADEAFDPDGHTDIADRIARDTPRRFAKLQRKYGRWGLAYLESLLRAADWAASGNPSAYLENTK